ncbi:hypothetical protein GPECTOR_4g690 [Gonium pectorale]|uniref:Uncharacterized protein n=1 Tax=Gonium pectorale TaxID=33097 RepID=A0A150GXS9_GONPE|nr:hypothetical protein GPECTOR_4g690 [Gonium pectorale]|eukprot:KXZ54625.1 hypothetical protein GPECTOR_4g690 [Gonium pectorale]
MVSQASGSGPLASEAASLPSPRSEATLLDQLLAHVPLSTEQQGSLREASGWLLYSVLRCRAASPLGRLLGAAAGCSPADTSAPHHGRDVELAALLLPPLSWRWLSVGDLGGWVDAGVVRLLREALIIQKAAGDGSASLSELVGWCVDSCSGPAAALAGLWGRQQGQALPPRARSFYQLLLHQLGHTESDREVVGTFAGEGGAEAPQSAFALTPAAVLCGSVVRTTALPASPRRPSVQAPGADGADSDGEAAELGVDDGGVAVESVLDGGEVGAARPGPSPDADLILVGELPPEAQAELSAAVPLDLDFAGRDRGRSAAGSASQPHGQPAQGQVHAKASQVNGSVHSAFEPSDAASGNGRHSGSNGSRKTLFGEVVNGRDVTLSSGQDEAAAVAGSVAAAAKQPLSGSGIAAAGGRPVASLMQRPSRGVVPPESDPGEATAAPGGEATEGTAGLGSATGEVEPSQRYYTQGGAVQHMPYVPVRLVALGPHRLRDLSHAELEAVAVPEYGPIVISNDPRVFPGTEAILTDFNTPAGEKLAVRLEYVVDRLLSNEVKLQLFNISRIVRKRTDNCRMYVNGNPVNVGDPGVDLVPGDKVWFGSPKFAFRVEALPSPPSAVESALLRFCYRGRHQTLAAARAAAAAEVGNDSGGDAVEGDEVAAMRLEADSGPLDMTGLANLSRRDPRRAQLILRRLAAEEPGNAAVWLIWAQLAARTEGGAGGGAAKARLLGGGAGGGPAAAALPPRRHNWLLVQALGNWGKHEWRLRMYGSARHLFRAAADEAVRHPYGMAGGGGGAVMHFWASRELECGNVRNARIVAAEALRKCPRDLALYVLAASIEREAGNLELAKDYCQRAYALDRTDKQLLLLWPQVEAGLGDRLKARLLFERAVDAHPLNTKILNVHRPLSPAMGVTNRADWASLEADLGNTALARELLLGGLHLHPAAPQLLVTLAKVERLEGRYHEALRLARAAQAYAGAFNTAAMAERAAALRALGEREMAANLSRHLESMGQLNRMKQQGYWGSEAWRAFVESTRTDEQKALVEAARRRRLALGWASEVRGAKPVPTGAAGDGRRPAGPEAQQWLQMQALLTKRAEVRRLEAQHAARVRAAELAAGGVVAHGGSLSSGDEEFDDDFEERPMGMPLLDSVRRPSPGDDDGF